MNNYYYKVTQNGYCFKMAAVFYFKEMEDAISMKLHTKIDTSKGCIQILKINKIAAVSKSKNRLSPKGEFKFRYWPPLQNGRRYL